MLFDRLSSSEVCCDHFKYLLQVYEMLEERTNNINVLILSQLICRQYAILSEKNKNDYLNSITKTSDPRQWSLLTRIIDMQKKKQIQQQIDASNIITQISTNPKNLEEQPSLSNFCLLVSKLI